MIEAEVVIVPPGGGEMDYTISMEFPALPREGDYISIVRGLNKNKSYSDETLEKTGSEDFIVRRVKWSCGSMIDANVEDRLTCDVTIECEYALSPYSSESHKKNAELHYQYRGKSKPRSFDNSGY